MRRLRGRWLALVALLLLVLFLSVLPLDPRPTRGILTNAPDLPIGGVAYQGAVNHTGRNVAALVVEFSEPLPIVPVNVYCTESSNCQYQLSSTWENVSSPLPALGSNWSLSSATTWVNGTEACGVTRCPTTNLSCDNSPTKYPYPNPTLSVPVACYHLGMLWNGSTFFAPIGLTKINYTVQRLATYLEVQGDHWGGAGKSATLSATVTAPASTYWAPTVANWSVPTAAWVVPYPRGTWDYLQTTVTPVPGSEPLPTTSYQTFSRYVLLQWIGGFPTTVGVNTTSTYTIGITTTGSVAQTIAQNLSNVSAPPVTSNLPSSVTLVVGNISGLGNGASTASARWTNGYTQNYTGSFVLSGSWISLASKITLQENGVTLTSSQWYDAGTYLVVQAGTLSIQNGTATTFSATYIEGSSFGFGTTLWTINGVPFNAIDLVFFGGATGLVVVAALNRIGKLPGQLAESALGVVAFTLIVVAWMVSGNVVA